MRLSSTVDRRLLISLRADPEVVGRLLPPGLRPTVVAESAVVGICFVRLTNTRPRGWPSQCGFTSEGAAHRVAVTWDTPDGPQDGVFVWERHTSSALNAHAGGRLFPGANDRASFTVDERGDHLSIGYAGRDGMHVDVEVEVADGIDSEVFDDVESASWFYERASVGLSRTRDGSRLEGMKLSTDAWAVVPVDVLRATSSFFDDPTRFPPGSIALDSGLLMRHVPVTWSAVA